MTNRDHGFGSALGYIAWRSTDRQFKKNYWSAQPIREISLSSESLLADIETSLLSLESLHPRQLIIPYWSIVLPLALLSAWLLIRKQKTTTAPPQI